jgi:hypothetical protein
MPCGLCTARDRPKIIHLDSLVNRFRPEIIHLDSLAGRPAIMSQPGRPPASGGAAGVNLVVLTGGGRRCRRRTEPGAVPSGSSCGPRNGRRGSTGEVADVAGNPGNGRRRGVRGPAFAAARAPRARSAGSSGPGCEGRRNPAASGPPAASRRRPGRSRRPRRTPPSALAHRSRPRKPAGLTRHCRGGRLPGPVLQRPGTGLDRFKYDARPWLREARPAPQVMAGGRASARSRPGPARTGMTRAGIYRTDS